MSNESTPIPTSDPVTNAANIIEDVPEPHSTTRDIVPVSSLPRSLTEGDSEHTASDLRAQPDASILNRTSPGPTLNEFRSLLEAAQRLANSASSTSNQEDWLDELGPAPLIRRSIQPDDIRRRIPLTRQYSGRPHVPGEDSGSESEDAVESERSAIMSRSEPTGTDNETHMPTATSYGTSQTQASTFLGQNIRRLDANRAFIENARTANEDTEQERERRERHRENMQRAFTLNRDLRRHHIDRRTYDDLLSSERTVNGSEHSNRSRFITSGSSPVQETLDDRTPHSRSTALIAQTTEPRQASASARRWRPTERLQDYASNYIRPGGASESVSRPRTDFQDDISSTTQTSSVVPRARSDMSDLGDHDDIVNRVERALQEYRIARRALRTNHDDVLPSPSTSRATLSEIFAARGRVYRPHYLSNRRGSNESSTDPNGPLPGWEERWRQDDALRQRARDQARERRRRIIIGQYLDADQDATFTSGPLFEGAPSTSARDSQSTHYRLSEDARRHHGKSIRTILSLKSKEMGAAKNALHYLARLRSSEMNTPEAWALASDLGLHNQSLLEKPIESLPLSMADLPTPVFTSWLEPGIVWSGTQSADDNAEKAEAAQSQAERDALRSYREARDRVDLVTRQNESFQTRMRQSRDPLERAILGSQTHDALTDSMNALEEAEQNLSSMLDQQLERNRERLRETDERLRRLRSGNFGLGDVLDSRHLVSNTKDQWRVKVALHSVDWDTMTLTGTMTASQLQNNSETDMDNDRVGMDSFFTGEIIDFSHFGLDTLPTRDRGAVLDQLTRGDDWKVGGAEVDLNYWAGIGPFKKEIEHAIQAHEADLTQPISRVASNKDLACLHQGENPSQASEHDRSCEEKRSDNNHSRSGLYIKLSEEQKCDISLKTMRQLLTDSKWLNENINQDGWVLMRWKERCFVAPGTGPNPEPTRPWIPSRAPALPPGSDSYLPTFGSTPYPASPRAGRIDRNSRQILYTTNAAEREEIVGSSSVTSQATQTPGIRATWGLTISGFYYVALNRKTGHIEALYYDCGSAPFQRLNMSPLLIKSTPDTETCTGVKNAYPRGDDPDAMVMDRDKQDEIPFGEQVKKKIEASKRSKINTEGIRTSFSMVEFR